MRIAQVSPLFESVPPKLYGGTERVVSYLTEELVRQGHEVTLFASGDSVTDAKLYPCSPRSLRLAGRVNEFSCYNILQLDAVIRSLPKFDVVHFHTDFSHFVTSRILGVPHLTTMHGRMDISEYEVIFNNFPDMPLVSISNAQRRPLPYAAWMKTIYHGLPTDLYKLNKTPENYLAFLGRVSPEKRLDRAIEIAVASGYTLKVAAKVDNADVDYYNEMIKPLLKKHLNSVEFIGEINDAEKQEFLGNAMALLFPIDWPEPFGLVMIEAMACGTPVIAFRAGSVPEVIAPGKTGFIVSSCAEAIENVAHIRDIDRENCRAYFEEHFSVRRMARNYVELYEKMIAVQGAMFDEQKVKYPAQAAVH